MMRIQRFRAMALAVAVLTCAAAHAVEIDFMQMGGVLPNVPESDWWYGCSATSAGMLMGYYDLLGYDNLVQGGDAELSTWGVGGSPLLHDAIASQGHIDDFYGGLAPLDGYGLSGDDAYAGRAFDCLADFMGTSQDSVGNVNGSTSFYYWTNGAAFDYTVLETYGLEDNDGMYGIYEYVEYCGYQIENLFTQATDNRGLTYGFSLDDYMAEIDAGRAVLIHVEGHTMLGYGYDEANNSTIYLRDTWTSGTHTMTWGGSYSGLGMWGVTVVDLAAVPEPMTLVMLGCLGAGMFAARKVRRQKTS